MNTMKYFLDEDVEVTIDFNYTPPCKGSYEGGLQMEPDEPADVEILSIKTTPGKEIPIDALNKTQLWSIEEACFDWVDENKCDKVDFEC